jgi:hypothetical protein
VPSRDILACLPPKQRPGRRDRLFSDSMDSLVGTESLGNGWTLGFPDSLLRYLAETEWLFDHTALDLGFSRSARKLGTWTQHISQPLQLRDIISPARQLSSRPGNDRSLSCRMLPREVDPTPERALNFVIPYQQQTCGNEHPSACVLPTPTVSRRACAVRRRP